MEHNGSYSKECTIEERQNDIICDDQTAKLVKIGILITVTQLASPVLGWIVDQVGAKRSAYIQAFCCFVGLGIAIIGTSTMTDVLLYVGFGLVSISTWFGSLLIIQLGLYFEGHTISRVIFILNTFFDGGTIVYLGLYWIQEWSQDTITTTGILSGYLLLAVLVYGGAMYFWTVAVPCSITNDDDDGLKVQVEAEKGQPEEADRSTASFSCEDDGTTDQKSSGTDVESGSTGTCSKMEEENKVDPEEPAEILSTVNDSHKKTDDGTYIPVAQRDGNLQLRSTPFLLLCFIFGLHVAMSNWNLATQRDFLSSLGDDDQDHLYLTIFTLLTPVSILGAPFVDYVILHYGWTASFQMINILSIGYMIIKVTSDNLSIQLIGFVIYSFYRSFLFGISFSYLPNLIGSTVVGLAAGIMTFTAGLANLFQMPMVNIAVKHNGGNFDLSNTIFLCLVVPTIIAVSFLGRYVRMENKAKEEEEKEQPQKPST